MSAPKAKMSLGKRIFLVLLLLLLIVIGIAAYFLHQELQSSEWQAYYLSDIGKNLKYRVDKGKSNAIRFPHTGPYDERLGYSQIPDFAKRLTSRSFILTEQARMSPEMLDIIDFGLFTPYHEKTQTGLRLTDCNNQNLYNASFPERVYDRFESIPSVLVDSLLFIENKELLDKTFPTKNPAVEWERFFKAVIDQIWGLIDADHEAPGGSTLVTQMEKYRHSPDGRTTSGKEKLRQMASASLISYLDGKDTTATRRQIVVQYLNSVPLAAKPGYGEVNGMGDGLWAWYGRNFSEVNALLKDNNASDGSSIQLTKKAEAFKQALSLMIAQRRPAYYLGAGEQDLNELSNSYLRLLTSEGRIPVSLRDAALPIKLKLHAESPVQPPVSFVARKASTLIRTQLAGLLNIPKLYSLDRLDLSVRSTLNSSIQSASTDLLREVKTPASAKAAGLYGFRLFNENDDPSKVIFSFVLFERGEHANYVRVQSDNYDQPFDINQGTKLDLGSTAKLRTLVTYLELIADIFHRHENMDKEQLSKLTIQKRDNLTRWVVEYLKNNETRDLKSILDAAMDRQYSASNGEAFYTGGGLHTFVNFEPEDNYKVITVREAIRRSVNLVFIRMMRDIVWHFMYRSPESLANKLYTDADDPRRKDYLARFADKEGREFIYRFYRKYQGKTPEEAEDLLISSIRPTAKKLATVYRSIEPNASLDKFTKFMHEQLPESSMTDKSIQKLYETYGIDKFSLADRGYLAGIHPLELWLAGFMRIHPGATLSQTIEASRDERQAVYVWLFKTSHKNAQDIRIQNLLEIEAFLEVNKAWRRLGYPFESFTPSYAASIGAAGDRPAALADLMGILVNHGMRLPTVRITNLHFAAGTPYDTKFQQQSNQPERVLPTEVADTAREAILHVVEEGTARRVYGAFTNPDGTTMDVGGKTGTGDHRFDVYGSGGRLVSSRVVNRSATFVFFIGDRYFGTVTAYAQEPYAAKFKFTSALSVQLLKTLAPTLKPFMDARTLNEPPSCQY